MPLSPELETRLNEFLQSAGPLRAAAAAIVDWQNGHDAEHRQLNETLHQNFDSYSFRLRSLEAATWQSAGPGKRWAGAVRLALVALVALGSGYAIHASLHPAVEAVARAR